jgi:hypothetical protein
MAYVRKTQKLVDDVVANLQKMRHAALEPLCAEGPTDTTTHTAVRESVVAAAWGLAPHLRGQIPDKWLDVRSKVYVKFMRDDGTIRHRFELSVPDSDKIEVPVDNSGYWRTVDVSPAYVNADTEKWLATIDELQAKAEQTRQQYDTLQGQLTMFINSHASLNAALKEMPELEMYIPQEYLTRVHEEVEPRERRKESNVERLEIDRESLVSIAVAHRITASV